jgi:alkaline phosphatase D
VTCEVTPAEWRSDYRILPYVSKDDAPIATKASFVVRKGRPGAERR